MFHFDYASDAVDDAITQTMTFSAYTTGPDGNANNSVTLNDVVFVDQAMEAFAQFLRASGFTYIDVVMADGGDSWTFTKNFNDADYAPAPKSPLMAFDYEYDTGRPFAFAIDLMPTTIVDDAQMAFNFGDEDPIVGDGVAVSLEYNGFFGTAPKLRTGEVIQISRSPHDRTSLIRFDGLWEDGHGLDHNEWWVHNKFLAVIDD